MNPKQIRIKDDSGCCGCMVIIVIIPLGLAAVLAAFKVLALTWNWLFS